MSNILDKPLESAFGYIQVLPGAFSAYRYKALQNSTPTSGPLASYFKGESMHNEGADVFSANMYLAEDRILCFELVTKRNEHWVLKYVKNAAAETDVPSALPELVSQRRRWLNGSFFAAVHSTTHYLLIFRSTHGILQKLLFTLQNVYNMINLLFNWFSIANFYLTFHFLFLGVQTDTGPFGRYGRYLFEAMRQLYFVSIVVTFISSFGNRPQGSKVIYHAVVILFAIIMIFLLFIGFYSVVDALPKTTEEWARFWDLFRQKAIFRDVVIATASTYGMYFLSSFLHLDPWHMLTSIVQYMLLLPTYVNVFMIYAFCNLHDISWGTKGDNTVQTTAAAPKPADAAATIARPKKLKPSASDLKSIDAVKGEDDEGEDLVEIQLPEDNDEELNAAYESMVEALKVPTGNQKQKRDSKTKTEDYFRSYRTKVVLSWMFSNLVIITIFTTEEIAKLIFGDLISNRNVSPYLTFLFWSVAGLAGVRFLGSTWYLVTWVGEQIWDMLFARGRMFDPQGVDAVGGGASAGGAASVAASAGGAGYNASSFRAARPIRGGNYSVGGRNPPM
ncbi:Chitin synthase, class 2 [Quaeritorhiza haematococci]|nr:Chitin synthase, class 2 [Quaeritorhiza haematococci]